jgi:hypothetical protein
LKWLAISFTISSNILLAKYATSLFTKGGEGLDSLYKNGFSFFSSLWKREVGRDFMKAFSKR